MKKGCFLLLILVALTYAWQGYKVTEAHFHDKIKIKTSGKLSDIAAKVLSVPLETPDSGAIQHIRHVRRDGHHLFLLSDNRLLHFNIQGKFIRQIAGEINDGNGACITQYALDTAIRQIIVIDSLHNVSKYDYSGNRISKARIKHPWQKLTAFAFHDGYLWVSAETLVAIHDRPDACLIKHDLYQLDADMNEISRQPLRIADTGRERIFTGTCVSELLADGEGVYAYSPPFGTEHLLKDTLYITEQKKLPLLYPERHAGAACIYPVRKGMRYMIATCKNYAGHPFTFCYDHRNFTAYLLPGGFRDDFFGTGYIADLQPVDMYGKSCCFIKSGRDIAKKYPVKTMSEDQPVLFLVDIKV